MNILNKSLLATALMSVSAISSASLIKPSSSNPVLMIVGTDTITRGEFEYMYHKNNSSALNGPISVDEYMKLFVNYKRKAVDAVSQMYPVRNKSYVADFNEYKKQLVFPYVMDKTTEEEFVKEAYDRLKTSRAVSHILIKTKAKNDVAAKVKIDDIYKKLEGGALFANLAKEYSECGSAERGGYLDFFTAFDMVYDFENVAYNTPVGHYSKPFKTQFGWHILLVHDEKKNYTRANIQEIFLSGYNDKNVRLADSLKTLIDKGAKFEKLAKKYSNYALKDENKGNTGWISSQTTPYEYLDEIYKIRNDGETKVIKSPLGVHVVKLLQGETTPPMDSTIYENLKKNIAKSDRYDAVIAKNRSELAFKRGFSINEDMIQMLARQYDTPAYEVEDSLKKYDAPVYTFDGTTYTPLTFLERFKDIQHSEHQVRDGLMNPNWQIKIDTSLTFADNIRNEIKRDVEREAESMEIDDIVARNIDIAYQLQEYSDGLLVYGISKEKIWDKGVNQSDSLQKYFEAHKDKYAFKEDRFVGYIFCFKDSAMMVKAKKYLNDNNVPTLNSDKVLREKFELKSKDWTTRDGAWVKGKNKLCDIYVYGDTTVHTSEVEKYPYVFTYGSITNRPMKAQQVRGQVLSDYQQMYEDKYNAYIENKYAVTIFQDVLDAVKKDNNK